MSQYCNRQVAGKKLKSTPPPTTENVVVPYDNSTRCVAMNSNMASSDPETQYQRLKLMQNTVRVPSSLYSMNAGALNVGTQSQTGESSIHWNQMSDRPIAHIQTARYSMKSSVSVRPGNLSPGGIGCDIKHNSYDRYLARIKAAGPLRKDNLTIDFGQTNPPFDPANPVYGGKTVKTSIGESSCGCGPMLSPDILSLQFFYYIDTSLANQPPSYFEQFLPFRSSDGALTYLVTVTKDGLRITIDLQYSFVDNGTTTDGLSFNVPGKDLISFYNTTTGLTMGAFGSIPLSRAGHQFEGLHVLPLFSNPPGLSRATVPNVPIILDNTSLAYCFANVQDFNGQSDIIMNMEVTKSINTSYMFYKSGYNPTTFSLNITNIYELEGMFQETSEFDPTEFTMYSDPIYDLPTIAQIARTTQPTNRTIQRMHNLSNLVAPKAVKPVPKKPVVVKKVTALLKKALTFKGTKFTYFNPNAQIQATTRLSKATAEPISVGEDMSEMFYDCIKFNPDPDTFAFFAVPTKLDYIYFNAQEFNGDLQNTVANYVETMDYAFAGATEFGSNDNIGLTEWDLASVTSTVNVFSNTSIEPQLVPNYFAFWYSFVYTGSSPLSDQDVINVIPLQQSGFFTVNTPTISSQSVLGGTEYLVQFNFKYDDNGTMNDGLTFKVSGKNLVSFYNTNTIRINIVKFGWIPLSRGGFQFAGLTVPIVFTDTTGTTAVPSILPTTSLASCFEGAVQFNENISMWDTKNATNMSSMFKNATTFNQNIRNWNVSNVLIYNDFATGATAFLPQNQPVFQLQANFVYSFIYTGLETVNYADYLPIINGNNSFTNLTTRIESSPSKEITVYITFDSFTDNGTTMDGLSFNNVHEFYGQNNCSLVNILKFGGIPLSRGGFQFFSVTNIVLTATDSPQILPNTLLTGFIANTNFNTPINNWALTNVTNMSFMFWYALAFNQDISLLNVSNVTNMESMFDGALVFNVNISGWNTSNVTNMKRMFYNATAFNRDLSTWNVSNVTNYVDFATGSGITNPPVFI
jgi:surface protein